ncbi:MAG TPA: hypothetical protein VH761_13670 [Ilumatobacteraceae bacterium]
MQPAVGDEAGETLATPVADVEPTTPVDVTTPVTTPLTAVSVPDELVTTSTGEPPPRAEPPTTTAVPATEHQLDVLTRALGMPGRPQLADVEVGQHEIVGGRELAVNAPIPGTWQYADLDAQSLPGASAEESEAAARALLAALGIDAGALTATFAANGPAIDVTIGDCILRYAKDADGPRLMSAICPVAAIAGG